MMVFWLNEILGAIGKLFVNPLLYVGFFYAIYLGYTRVKRERKNFHIRVQDGWFEFRTYWTKGLISGLISSIILVLLGVMVPVAFLITATAITLFLSIFGKPSVLSPAYTGSLSFFLLMAIVAYQMDVPFFAEHFESLSGMIAPEAVVVMALLIVIEGILIVRNASANTSPKIIRSKRGLQVGVHESKRLWLVPLIFLIPEGVFSLNIPYWPVVPIGEQTFSLIIFPYLIGFGQDVYYTLPKDAIQNTGKQVIGLGVVLFGLAIAGFWYPILSIASALLAIIGRLVIAWRGRVQNKKHPLFFLRNESGIVVLDVIPHSPADKMGIQVGEIIVKVNGVSVNNDKEFYEALQVNRAFCKLEVIDLKGEKRYVQQALYEGEHHELGVILVDHDKQWQSDVS